MRKSFKEERMAPDPSHSHQCHEGAVQSEQMASLDTTGASTLKQRALYPLGDHNDAHISASFIWNRFLTEATA